MTKRNVAVTDIVGLAASLPTLRVFAAALLLAPLAACAAPLPAQPAEEAAEQAAPAVQQTAPAAAAPVSAGSFSDWLKNTIDKRNAK